MSVWRFLGFTTDRSKPWRARLGRWWVHAAVCALLVVLFGWMLGGAGFEHPDAARDIAFFVMLPLAVVYGVQAVVAWRYQQNH